MELCAAKRQQRNFGRNSQSNGRADRAEAAIDVNKAGRMRQNGGVSFGEQRRIEERPPVEARDVMSEELRRTPTMIEDFDTHLAAVRVSREAQLDTEFSGARKRIGIVR